MDKLWCLVVLSERTVDAKYFDRGLGLSGSKLLWALCGTVSTTALLLDWVSGRSPASMHSLFLPLVTGTLATGLLGYWVIPLLSALKAGQFIREDGPKAHLKKAGTPTMGGIFVIPVGVVIALLGSGFNPSVIAACGLTLAYGFVGWLDDWQILKYRSNKGISPKTKLALQLGFGLAFCAWLAWGSGLAPSITQVQLPFGLTLGLGFLFWPLALFVMAAESNATNLTDGVDGLAAGTGAIVLFGLGTFIAPSSPDLMLFCAALAGSYLGFLMHNRNPAKVFMGDTGSLAMGGAVAAVGLMGNLLWVLLILGGMFLVESLSVIAQVSYYKATKGADGVGKRLFRMAPIHHHLELSGWAETQVVASFYIITAMLGVCCWILGA
jgi:phospho-N-acetylmuramoyl-pentapeptide-transferase